MRGRGPSGTVLAVDGGVEYDKVASEVRDLGFRVAALASMRRHDQAPSASVGGALQGALLLTTWKGKPSEILGLNGSSTFALGPTVEAAWMSEPSGSSGRLGLGLTLDWYRLTEWTVR